MSADRVRQIADAVLYEGYVLWPYRRSALKNRQRFTFGGIYPQGWPEDRSELRVECLLEAEAPVRARARVRFLHVVRRRLLDARGEPTDELTVGGERLLGWDEATEREVRVPVPGRAALEIPEGASEEELRERDGRRAGGVRRSWSALQGSLEATTVELRPALHRVSLRVVNTARWDGGDRERTLRRTLCSTHAILEAEDGAFVSPADPPEDLRGAAAGCHNDGAWPVLVGEPGERSTMLASPIILEDYPRVAPESPGDLFDGAEIEQLLTLNILALPEAEKAEMRASDPRAREILERTESLSAEQLMRLHGTIRDLRREG